MIYAIGLSITGETSVLQEQSLIAINAAWRIFVRALLRFDNSEKRCIGLRNISKM